MRIDGRDRQAQRVGKQYVSRLIRLAFLAPEMVERIAAGRQPPELTAQALRTGRFDIPVDWVVQKAPKLASMTRTRSFFYDLLQDVTVQALRSQ